MSFKVGDKVYFKYQHGVIYTIIAIEGDLYVLQNERKFTFSCTKMYISAINKWDD